MTSPLKITLKLSGPRPPTGISQSPTHVSPKTTKVPDSITVESPRKRAKPNGRSRKPKVEGAPVLDSQIAVDDDGNVAEEVSNQQHRRGGGNGSGGNGAGNGGGNQTSNMGAGSASISRKELLKYKDIKVRKWVSKPLVFYTLDGSEIQLPSWQSDEKMTINKRTTEPMTVAEIDQLFSSTSGEKDFRPFLCTQPGCSKSFTTFDQLQTHETNMHGTKKLVCGIDSCHKSFVTTGQLTKHRKMVHFRAARKAKLAAAAAAAAATENGDDSKKDLDDETGGLGGDNDSVDIANL
ncbi:uncharacterized protein EV154DRAFT_484598 [Mucor mucedo]|uniref:uncharacterized protein n=1 Tax=Mucor mucedo TaxID=29922 RepID=UPI002220B954|nr:uncharacterized protein EV154DRAFT_484598 [Mucor mucedo]KAI7887878.1 hypothetical protein EV154DRAFT_484598 [Mucor mucedo]